MRGRRGGGKRSNIVRESCRRKLGRNDKTSGREADGRRAQVRGLRALQRDVLDVARHTEPVN